MKASRLAAALLALLALLAAGARAADVANLRPVPSVELGALPVGLPALAQRLGSALPTIKVLDLAVPAANAGVPAGPAVAAAPVEAKVVPSIYQTARAEALLGRLARAGAAGAAVQAPEAPAEPAQARKTIAAVNAVLKDFTPEQIARLSQEKLAALSGVLFDHMDGRSGVPDAAAAAALSEASAERMLARRKDGLREVLLNPGHTDMHPDDIEVHGVPSAVKPVDGGDVVWRHYTTKEGYEAILESGALQNGYVGYVQLSRGTFKRIFREVNGLFLTRPDVKGDEVGVPKSEFPHYVDIMLPAAMKVLEIEAGKIWLVPLPGRTRGWVAGMYRAWSESGKSDNTYRRMLVELDASGGPGPDLSVPVKIVAKGSAR